MWSTENFYFLISKKNTSTVLVLSVLGIWIFPWISKFWFGLCHDTPILAAILIRTYYDRRNPNLIQFWAKRWRFPNLEIRALILLNLLIWCWWRLILEIQACWIVDTLLLLRWREGNGLLLLFWDALAQSDLGWKREDGALLVCCEESVRWEEAVGALLLLILFVILLRCDDSGCGVWWMVLYLCLREVDWCWREMSCWSVLFWRRSCEREYSAAALNFGRKLRIWGSLQFLLWRHKDATCFSTDYERE